jgi:thiamine biosynthesis lipoprotein
MLASLTRDATRLATAAMGTRFELVLPGADPIAARSAGEAAIERIEEAHRLFTRFESSSLLAHLQRVAPASVAVDPDTAHLFADLAQVAAESGGAFDPTGAGAWNEIEVDLLQQRIGLRRPDIDLDLGAIAKGHAIDLAVAALREAGIEHAFVHGGTSSGFGFGTQADGSPWRIGWAGGPETFELVDQAYAVSATRRIRDGKLEEHVVDPRRGGLVREARQVIVVGPTARWADAWATAALVLGERPTGMDSRWTVLIR